jgi:hypothetical protein
VKLPRDAVIAPEKLTNYLFVKRSVGDKSEFLKQAGYTLDNWQQLENDIRQQILTLDALTLEKTIYGDFFEIRGLLVGPNKRTLRVRTVWIEETESGLTKFVTLYPDRRRTR